MDTLCAVGSQTTTVSRCEMPYEAPVPATGRTRNPGPEALAGVRTLRTLAAAAAARQSPEVRARTVVTGAWLHGSGWNSTMKSCVMR